MRGAMPTQVPVAILGAAGYAGELALRILLDHPAFTVVHAGSDRLPGTPVGAALPQFARETDLVFAPDTVEAIRASGAKAVLLAKKSADVTRVVPDLVAAGLKIVDIGAEFRLREHDAYKRWYGDDHACPQYLAKAAYGLCEIHRDAIARADVVGNPGCYATSVLLPLIPLMRAGVVDRAQPVVAVGYSGLSGAGKRFIESNNNLFYSVNENLRSYKQVGHQHTGEIDQELSAAAGAATHCSFVPHLAPITRGIHTTITATLAPGRGAADAYAAWAKAYADRPFARAREKAGEIEVTTVTGTNFCDFAAVADGRTLILLSVVDNLIKGASGQAVQNLNLMFGLDETTGLIRRSF